MPRKIVVAACAGDAQYWDISNPGNPTSGDGEPHTHIQREVRGGRPDDAGERADRVVRVHAQRDRDLGRPGGRDHRRVRWRRGRRAATATRPSAASRGSIRWWSRAPRSTGSTSCWPLHHPAAAEPRALRLAQRQRAAAGRRPRLADAGLLPGRELAGRLHRPERARARSAFSDLETSVGLADSWSSYWYNDVLYVNGGLNRRGGRRQPGLRVLRRLRPLRQADQDPRLEVAEPADPGELAAARGPEFKGKKAKKGRARPRERARPRPGG